MAKAPAGTTEDPAMVEEVGSEDELEDITPVMEEIWTPPYHVPESSWSVPGPLDHAQTPHYTFCLLCEKWCSAGHLMSAGHSTAIQKWIQSGKPVLKIPPRFAEDEQVEMLIQSRHPTWSRRTILAAKQAILQMAYYRAQEGTFRGEIPPEMDENLKKVLEEVREHPHQPVVQPAASDDEAWGSWRASPDLRRPVTPPRRPVTPPKQPPRQKAKVEPSPVLQPPMPVPAEVPPLPAPVEAPPLGVPLPIQPPLPPPSTAAPTYSWTPTPAPRVGAVYSAPSGAELPSERRVGPPIGGGERGMADSAEPGASGAAKGGEQIVAMPPPAPQRYTVPPPPAPTGSTELPPSAPSSSTTTPWSHVPGFGTCFPRLRFQRNRLGSLKDHAVPKGQPIARHSAGAALPPREPKPVYASCAEGLPAGLAPHVICSACGSSVAWQPPCRMPT